jgi:uroporphyrinogen-III synthase
MRVLVTRAEPEAGRTAEALRARGCEPVLAPVSVITPRFAKLPEGPFAAVLLSSQNAVRHGVALVPPEILALPAFAVGQRTAEAARQAGWRNVRPGPGDAGGLAGEVAALLPAGARLLYLAGTPRKPVLESALVGQGYEVVVLEVYQASAASRLPRRPAANWRWGRSMWCCTIRARGHSASSGWRRRPGWADRRWPCGTCASLARWPARLRAGHVFLLPITRMKSSC